MTGSKRTAARLLIGVLAALGLVVMHGVTAHGLVHIHEPGHEHAAPAQIAAAPHHGSGSHDAPEHGSVGHEHDSHGTMPGPGDSHTPVHVHLAALCVAVVLTALTALAAIARRATRHQWRIPPLPARQWIAAVRAPVPIEPLRFELCVARC